MDEAKLDQLYDKFDQEFSKVEVREDVKARFRSAVKHFLDIVKARNKKILEYDSLVVQQNDLRQAVKNKKVEQDNLDDLRAQAITPLIAARRYKGIMEDIQRQQMRRCSELLWLGKRAYELWSLRTFASEFPIVSDSVATLLSTKEALHADFVKAEDFSEGKPPSFNPPLILKLSLSPFQRKTLVEKRTITFTLSPQDLPVAFRPAVCIFVSSVAIELSDVRFAGTLTQSGRNFFVDENNKGIEFAMRPIKNIVQMPLDGIRSPVVTLGQAEGKFAGVSLFSDWILELTEVETPSALPKVDTILLAFEGTHRTWIP